MLRWILLGIALGVAGLAVFASARADEASDARARFKREMDAVYDYLPADVTQEVRDRKVKEMDRFWEFVGSDPKTWLPLLREALRDEASNRYFLYDGSGLLVEKSKDPSDWQLAADATARCRIRDVGPGYFHFCRHLARNGANCVPAVLQILGDPKFTVHVPQHALTLRQSDCVRLCLLLLPEETWVAPARTRFAAEKDPAAAASLARCLRDAVTPEADAEIRRVAADEKAPEAARNAARATLVWIEPPSAPLGEAKRTREEFAAWLAKADEAGRLSRDAFEPATQRDARHLVAAADAPALRSLRRKTAQRLSDEAILEIGFLTELLRRATSAPR